MKIVELRNGLAEVQRLLDSFGVKKQAAELHGVIEALSEFDDLSLPDLVKRLKALKAPQSKKTPKPVDEAAVEDALKRLQASAHLTDEFETTVVSVLKDKRLKHVELAELARRFGGTVPEKTTKSAVAEFLRERRLEMKRQGGLGATIDRMFGRTGN